MEKQPQFPFAPKDFARCLNATCPRSQNCLRRTAALQDTDEHLFLKVVNPLRYPKEGEECELFRSTPTKCGWHGESPTCWTMCPTKKAAYCAI